MRKSLCGVSRRCLFCYWRRGCGGRRGILYNGEFSVNSELQDLPAAGILTLDSDGSDAYMQEELTAAHPSFWKLSGKRCENLPGMEVKPDTCYRMSWRYLRARVLAHAHDSGWIPSLHSEQFCDTEAISTRSWSA
jgi:hypothetical protein